MRATTSQRCVRAGGKHNDLENVGYTARHHTFFEMLGNFSFGDYFKRDAIRYAWELLTGVYGLPPDRLWARSTSDDDEAYDIWTKDIGVPRERIVRIGDKPGGQKYASRTTSGRWPTPARAGRAPRSSTTTAPGIAGGPPGSPDADGDRYIEIWNLVFMQFDRDAAGHADAAAQALRGHRAWASSASPRCCRASHSNYEIDLFQDLIKAAARETGHEGPRRIRRSTSSPTTSAPAPS